ncbi:ABC transporter permease subunit [Candidatus Poribacteria bacterium]|nr:ABC transporter permease subunit [Candidatus Poribacteria bacterium]
MFQYVLKRLLLMAVTLFGITVITFAVTRMTPGEPTFIPQQGAASSLGTYEQQLEQNRRNLGLDKPRFFNLNFEDRDYAARQALEDFLRTQLFWRQDAGNRLRLSSTIAFPHALRMIEDLKKVQGSVDHHLLPTTDATKRINVEDGIERIAALLPALAQERPEEVAALPLDEQIAWWNRWGKENEARWEAGAVASAVEGYLAGTSDTREVLIRGGYAVPPLIKALGSRDDAVVLRASEALTGLTGYDYLSSRDAWTRERAEVVRKWNSLYSRDRIRFSTFNRFQHAVNVVANTQFGVWMKQVLFLDFGQSFKHRKSVNQIILERLPVSMMMAAVSIFFSYLIAIPLGIFSAVKKNSGGDKIVTVILFLLYSLPSFWVAQMLLMSLTGGPAPWGGEWPNFFPTRGLSSEGLDWRRGQWRDLTDLAWHLVLPTICFTYGSLAFLSRQMRGSMLDVISQDYVRTAVAKGLNQRAVVFKHVLRNSLIPILTISAGLLPELIAGSIIIEQIFTIPGMGQLSFEAILHRDYPVINAILFFSAALTLIGILLADLSYALVDPRISYN